MPDLHLDSVMEDAQEAQMISDFISKSRSQQSFDNYNDDMDVDQYMLKTEAVPSLGNVSYLTIDTNFILSQLEVVEQLRRLSSDYHLVIIIPSEVIRELDGLKNAKRSDSRGGRSVGSLARSAIEWVFQSLSDQDSHVKGQANSQKIHKNARNDDAIVDCALYFKEHFPQSLHILLSNDKNLCSKALINEILTISYRVTMSPREIAEKVYEENLHRFGRIDPSTVSIREVEVPVKLPLNADTLAHACETVYKEVTLLVRSIVTRCIKQEYGDDLSLIRNFNADADTCLEDQVLKICRFWMTVFSHRMTVRPFEQKGNRKVPMNVQMPGNASELKDFVYFWSASLSELYEGVMDKSEVESLQVLVHRWHQLSGLH